MCIYEEEDCGRGHIYLEEMMMDNVAFNYWFCLYFVFLLGIGGYDFGRSLSHLLHITRPG